MAAYGATGLTQIPNWALYVDAAGRLRAWIGGTQSVVSSSGVVDGAWHLATLVYTPATGTALYVNGTADAASSSMTGAPALLSVGAWTVGCAATAPPWPSAGTQYFRGTMRFAATYNSSLTSTQVQQHYRAGI